MVLTPVRPVKNVIQGNATRQIVTARFAELMVTEVLAVPVLVAKLVMHPGNARTTPAPELLLAVLILTVRPMMSAVNAVMDQSVVIIPVPAVKSASTDRVWITVQGQLLAGPRQIVRLWAVMARVMVRSFPAACAADVQAVKFVLAVMTMATAPVVLQMPAGIAVAGYQAVADPARIATAVLAEPRLAPVIAAFVAVAQAILVAVAANLPRSAACVAVVQAVKLVVAVMSMATTATAANKIYLFLWSR
jgi:hypothetical protein